MNNNISELALLTDSIKKTHSGIGSILPNTEQGLPFNVKGDKNRVTGNDVNSIEVITGYFDAMLGSTKGMLVNMGLMDSGFAKTVQLILQILNSIGSGSGGGFGGLFSGLLGVIGGLVGGPLGAAAGTGIGGILGRTSAPLNTQLNSSISSGNTNGVINQVIIKNPVTFTKAFDVEVRTRNLRGGIDL